MTVWTCNILYKHDATGEMRPRLWGNEDCELLAVLYGIGASLDDLQPNTSWENYLITPEQQVLAVDKFGAIPTDYLEPTCQRAEQQGDWLKVAAIEVTRENWRKGRLPPPCPLLRDRFYKPPAAA